MASMHFRFIKNTGIRHYWENHLCNPLKLAINAQLKVCDVLSALPGYKTINKILNELSFQEAQSTTMDKLRTLQ